jgi:apolipoprotein N-acyltransferase
VQFKTPGAEALTLFALGAVGALAFAPHHWLLCLVVSLSGLLWRLEKTHTPASAVRLLWIWGLGQFCVSFHWISYSLGVDWGKFFWVLPFSLLGIPAILALFPALFCGLFWHRFSPGLSRWLYFAAAWGVAEWVRGHLLFGGFPWNLVSAVWGDSLPLLQTVSLWGVYALGVLTVLGATLPSLFLVGAPQSQWLGKILVSASMGCLFLGLGFWGSLRIKTPAFVPHAWIRLVQPSVDQKVKWSPQGRTQRLQELFDLTRAVSTRPVTHIIWPESPLPFVLNGTLDLDHVPLPLQKGQTLLTGMIRLSQPAPQASLHNSLMLFDHGGHGLGCYDKFHLVPFGEYVPLRRFLSRFMDTGWMGKMTAGRTDFVPGKGPQTLKVPGLPPVSPLICFDVAFPGEVVDPKVRPGWLLDVTNDGWFEDSWGLFQHFEQARFRAVEEGLPLVRVANTGISGVVTVYGEVLAQLPLQKPGVWDFALPQSIPPTFYVWWGDVWFWVLILSLLFGAWRIVQGERGAPWRLPFFRPSKKKGRRQGTGRLLVPKQPKLNPKRSR